MVQIRAIALLLIAALFGLPPSSGRAQNFARSPADGRSDPSETSLFAQSAIPTLDRDFSSGDISFLLLDAHTGALLASRWDHPETPIPLGSLVKPFTALAYGELHEFQYPTHICRGTTTGCWRLQGHGAVDLISAIAYSCNSYFRVLTAGMTAAELSATATRFGLEPPAPGISGAALAGLGEPEFSGPNRATQWRTSPLHMARAYLELIRRGDEPGVRLVLAGMAASARQGTAAAVDRALPHSDALAKTGTAPCTHVRHAPGDGFTVVLAPANQPQILLLVRVHGVPGAQAAKTAGEMLRHVEP